MNTSWIRYSGLAAGLWLAGCSSNATASKTPADADGSTAALAQNGRAAGRNGDSVNVDPRIAQMCNLPQEHFAFDSSSMSPTASRALDAVARCFTSGPGKGKRIAVIGHADPRGDEEYNFGLGQRRAGAVASYLEHAGLAQDHVATSSRGELDATGHDEAGWANDRRVDITLAE